MMNSYVQEMIGSQFPFGELEIEGCQSKKVLIRKRYTYKNQSEYGRLKEKIDKLKSISHKNTINLRSTEDSGNGHIDLFYPYVSIPLQESFNENSNQTVKELHKQFIELIIYLAKNYILTSFNPARCGVNFTDNKSIIKYYLPLNEIIITSNVSMLQRSVQLFNVQSMHYLDTLSQSALNTTLQNSSQCSFKNRIKLFPQAKKYRRESQPSTLLFNNQRKFSTFPIKETPQMRKLSNLSKQLSQFSQMRRKRTKESSRISTGSFNTFKNLISQSSDRDLLRSYVSQSKNIEERVIKIAERSYAALSHFQQLKVLINQHRSLSNLLSQIKI